MTEAQHFIVNLRVSSAETRCLPFRNPFDKLKMEQSTKKKKKKTRNKFNKGIC